jgi:hypothetical protein
MIDEGELQQIIKCGIKIVQTHTIVLMQDPMYKPVVLSTLETHNKLLEDKAEECCFAMKGLRWNINDKHI